MQGDRSGRSHDASALAVGADHGRALDNTRADTLTRHFKQAEVRNATDLDARPVILQCVLDSPLDRTIVARFLHIDEVDHDEPGEVAQTQLTGDLFGGLEIGAQRSVFDIVLSRGPTRVDIDCDQRFGLIDNDVAARLKRHLVGEHRVELGFDARLSEDRRSRRDRVARC